MGRFDGKTVFITGGARGQGRSHAVAFAREGADIVVCDAVAPIDTVPYDLPTPDDLDETVRQVEDLDRRCVAEQADVRDHAAVESVVERGIAQFGKIDICLANAGIFTFSTIADMDDTTWNTMIDVNLTGVFHTLRAVLPSMREQGSGRIIATSSMAGKMGFANVGHYVATKWGVIGLVKSLAQEVAAEGITVNAICPTGVATTMIHNDAAYRLFLPDMENPTKEDAEPAFAGLNAIPIPWVEVEDISNAMMFLASDDARYITGETLAVAAGQNATNAG
jgi:SDR family mycofactocin-dependent oxidoreductase